MQHHNTDICAIRIINNFINKTKDECGERAKNRQQIVKTVLAFIVVRSDSLAESNIQRAFVNCGFQNPDTNL